MTRRALAASQLAICLLATPVAGEAAPAKMLPRPESGFRPAHGEGLEFPFELSEPAEARIEIYTGDRDLVRTLRSQGTLPVGRTSLRWDGRDDKGQFVPDEAYHPVLSTRSADDSWRSQDPSASSGGVVIDRLPTELLPDGTIEYQVSVPSRVLIRIGIKGGAMMRALETWTPKPPGRAQVKWDGYDASHVVRLLGQPGLTVLVTAFSLPDHTVLTSGDGADDYFAYRVRRGWTLPLVDSKRAEHERDGQRLSRQAALPRSALQDPRVTLRVVEGATLNAEGVVQVSGPVTFRVDIPAHDKWLLQQSVYEIGFFLDQQFVSEEETGFTPLHWRWLPRDLSPGTHTMTVNVSGLWGQVGVASIGLFVQAPK